MRTLQADCTWRPWRVCAAVVVVADLAGCGGGGGNDAAPPWSGVTIEQPTEMDTLQTDQPQVAPAGRALVPGGSQCSAALGTIAPGYRIRWRNAADGAAGNARMQLNCLPQVSLTWNVASVALEPGADAVDCDFCRRPNRRRHDGDHAYAVTPMTARRGFARRGGPCATAGQVRADPQQNAPANRG